MGAIEPEQEPQFLISTGIDEGVTQQLQSLRELILEEPAVAREVIGLYARDSETGDKWSALLSGAKPEKRYPFRLINALGQISFDRTLRYVDYDTATEKAIESNEQITRLLPRVRNGSAQDKEAAVRDIQLRRLEIYAGQLSTWHSHHKDVSGPRRQSEAS